MTENSNTPVQVQGIYLKSTLDQFRKLAGEKLAEELKKEVGYTSVTKLYPVESLIKLLESIAKYKFQSEKIDRRVAKFITENFYQSPLGKTLKSLFGINPHYMFSQLPHYFKIIFRGFFAETEKVNENTIKMTLENNPFPDDYFAGIIDGGMDHFENIKYEVTWKNIGQNKIEYILKWNKNVT